MSSENFGLVDFEADETSTMSFVKLVITYLHTRSSCTLFSEHQKPIATVETELYMSNCQQQELHNAKAGEQHGTDAKQGSCLQEHQSKLLQIN